MIRTKIKSIIFYLNSLILCILLSNCGNQRNPNLNTECISSNFKCLRGKVLVMMVTNKGRMIIELNGNSAPLTAGNFVNLINRRVYDRTSFHRVIREPFPFIIQGGDPQTKEPRPEKGIIGLGNYVAPSTGKARFIPLEIKLKNEEIPRYKEKITNPIALRRIELTHKRGSLGMAREENINSGSSQFYIALRPLPELDGRYSVFGKVIKGLNILEEIEKDDLILEAYIIDDKKKLLTFQY